MTFDSLIQAEELKQLLDGDTTICLFDCRFNLADINVGRTQYLEGHIPGAFYAHLDENLSGSIIPGSTGRHPLPRRDAFLAWLRKHGVNNDTRIVAYDSSGGGFAARLWWLCRWVGHRSCAVLNGGLPQWNKCGGVLDNELPVKPPEGTIEELASLVVCYSTEDILQLDKSTHLLVDAREDFRYRGEKEPIDPVAGHIPGAISLPYVDNLDEDKCFLHSNRLAEKFQKLTDDLNGRIAIMYCGSGVTAAHNILAMTYAKLDTPALYADSWSAWILDKRRPIAVGSNE